MKTVDEVVKELKESDESITCFVHNQSIELKRIRAKGQQTYRFYGGDEYKRDAEYHNFWADVVNKLTEGMRSLREIYGVQNKI